MQDAHVKAGSLKTKSGVVFRMHVTIRRATTELGLLSELMSHCPPQIHDSLWRRARSKKSGHMRNTLLKP